LSWGGSPGGKRGCSKQKAKSETTGKEGQEKREKQTIPRGKGWSGGGGGSHLTAPQRVFNKVKGGDGKGGQSKAQRKKGGGGGKVRNSGSTGKWKLCVQTGQKKKKSLWKEGEKMGHLATQGYQDGKFAPCSWRKWKMERAKKPGGWEKKKAKRNKTPVGKRRGGKNHAPSPGTSLGD